MALLSAYLRAQLTELLRAPGYWVPTVLFPAMLYSFFGATQAGDGLNAGFAMASFAVYGVVGVAFYQFGVGIAQDRESPWEDYLRTLPATAAPRITARVISAALFATLAASLVVVAAHVLAEPAVGAGALARLGLTCLLAAPPFALLGVALGYWCSAKAAVAAANLIFLPLAFLGGLWLPPGELPAAVATLSGLTPTRHFAELAWSAIAMTPPPWASAAWLLGYSFLFGALALWGYRRSERARYR